MDNNEKYTVYTDGGCISNPGGAGGIGIVILAPDGTRTEISEGYAATTNNRMEITAAIRALGKLPDGASVDIYSDSQYLIETVCGAYQRKTNFDLWDMLEKASRGKKIFWHWVRGHNGNDDNEVCDQLATEAMQNPALTDTGYEGPIAPAKPAKTQKAQKPDIPSDVDPFYSGEKKTVKDACAKVIKQINSKAKPSFKDFSGLKVGGSDGWSRLKEEAARELFPESAISYLEEHIHDQGDLMTALKWYGRGLRIDHAAHKVNVDAEVTANAISSRAKW